MTAAVLFLRLAKSNKHLDAGWINSAYSVSKICVSVLSRIQQREMDKERPNDRILINYVHPGNFQLLVTVRIWRRSVIPVKSIAL